MTKKGKASWYDNQLGLVESLVDWLRSDHEIGDVWSATFDPCGGCALYTEHCEGYDHAWICCRGKDWEPREADQDGG